MTRARVLLRLAVAGLAAAALGLLPARALEGPGAAPPFGERLRSSWRSADDAQRATLAEELAATADRAAVEIALEVAGERVRTAAEQKARIESIDKRLADRAKPPEPGAKPAPPPEAGQDDATLRTDRDVASRRLGIETEWNPKLAVALGRALDNLADKDFAAVSNLLRDALAWRTEGARPFLAAMFRGGSGKARTAAFLSREGLASLDAYRKALAARVEPYRDLEKVNEKYNERVTEYLEQQAKQGNVTDQIPRSLVDKLIEEKRVLQVKVDQFQEQMETADRVRLASRAGLEAVLVAAPEAARGPLLDRVEKDLLAGKDFEVRCFGVLAVATVPGDRPAAALKAALGDADGRVVAAALEALGERGGIESVDLLVPRLSDPRWPVRAAAAAGLARTGTLAAVPPLLDALAKAEARSADDVHEALKALTGQKPAATAAAWTAWWEGARATFRGPRDEGGAPATAGAPPGAPAAPGAPGAGTSGDATTVKTGESVSFYGIETKSERVLFVVDFSGSMNFASGPKDGARPKIDILREELRKTLTGLPDGAKYNIVAFSHDVRVWRKGPAVRDSKSLKEALDWVDKQKVLGSTNIYDALETGFNMMGVGLKADKSYDPAYDTIFFMTDGTPTSGKVLDPELIRGSVRRWNEASRVRVHVVGMGGHRKESPNAKDDLDEKFLKSLAEENGGQCVIR